MFEKGARAGPRPLLSLRIPAWAEGATVQVNRVPVRRVWAGQLVMLERTWSRGDRVHRRLPLTVGLEPLDASHPDVAALVCGLQVLFPLSGTSQPPGARRAELLDPRRTAPASWQVGKWHFGAAGAGLLHATPSSPPCPPTGRFPAKAGSAL